jgi:hypothetical protein
MPSASGDPTVCPSARHSGGHPPSVCWKTMEIARPEWGNVLSKVKIIYRKVDINCVQCHTDRGLTPGQGSTRIALPCHNILNIIVQMEVSCIRDSDAFMSVYRTDITWSHCSQNFPMNDFFRSRPNVSWNFLTVKKFTSRSLFPRYRAVLYQFCFQILMFEWINGNNQFISEDLVSKWITLYQGSGTVIEYWPLPHNCPQTKRREQYRMFEAVM